MTEEFYIVTKIVLFLKFLCIKEWKKKKTSDPNLLTYILQLPKGSVFILLVISIKIYNYINGGSHLVCILCLHVCTY